MYVLIPCDTAAAVDGGSVLGLATSTVLPATGIVSSVVIGTGELTETGECSDITGVGEGVGTSLLPSGCLVLSVVSAVLFASDEASPLGTSSSLLGSSSGLASSSYMHTHKQQWLVMSNLTMSYYYKYKEKISNFTVNRDHSTRISAGV